MWTRSIQWQACRAEWRRRDRLRNCAFGRRQRSEWGDPSLAILFPRGPTTKPSIQPMIRSIRHQFRHFDFQCFGEFADCRKADILQAALDGTYVSSVEIRQIGEFLLRYPLSLSDRP